jgi:uncharacterized damage-inducible protein DinB
MTSPVEAALTDDHIESLPETAYAPITKETGIGSVVPGSARRLTGAVADQSSPEDNRRDRGDDGLVTSRSGIDAMLYLLDEAFRGVGIEESNESQALLPNLRSVPASAWHTIPEGMSRSIEAVAVHVGACKIMYADYAFGSASLRFATPAVEPWPAGEAPMAEVLRWLEEAHETLVRHVAALGDDDELDADRLTNWGERRPTRWIIAAMITHDAYHAGEINHLRSLQGDDDRWRFQQLGFG